MKINLKINIRKSIVALIISTIGFNSFAFTSKDIRFLTFENGLKMYLIEDTSSALVRMELRVGAGYSSQDETNAGYFPLYARLKNGVIDSEGVSRVTTCAPGDAEKAMQELSELLEPLKISDKKLRSEIATERANTTNYANDISGFINSAIEAKVFPTNPWKRESSANPNLFTQNSVAESRSILNKIADEYYTPDNTIIYINGNITATAAETFAIRYFNKFTNPATKRKTVSELESKIAEEFEKKASNKNNADSKSERRFVLTDSEFSEEMSQIVVQFTTLGQFECDMAATTMDEDFSEFKESLTKEKSLGIRGTEYINAAANHKKGSSRLVIQSLLEKTKTPPPEQVSKFLSKIEGRLFSTEAFNYEIKQYSSEFIKKCDSSTEIMQILADWTTLRNDRDPEKTLFNRINELQKIKSEELSKKISKESPFVFVFLNPKVYAKYEKDFKKMGFSNITKQNGAWFRQAFYQNKLKTKNSKGNDDKEKGIIAKSEEDTFQSARRFVEKNTADFRKFTLSNEIPVVVKRTDTNTATIAITIEGGDILFAKKTPGLAGVLVDAIAINIRNQLDTMHYKGYTKGIYSVRAKTDTTYSVISVSFSSDELSQTLEAITEALIYGDITPAMGDGISYDERTQWRLKSGTLDFQMLSYAIRKLYEKENIALLYDDSSDKPKLLNYPDISGNYPTVLDSTRYSLVLAGNFDINEYFTELLDETFGSLGTNKVTSLKESRISEPKFNTMERRIKLRHLFLTDVSADKAGPRPAVLIPTTKFLDPILYISKSPEISGTESALFNAITLELGRRIEIKAQKSEPTTKVKIHSAERDLPFVRIIVTNAERTGLIDKFFKESIEELKSDLSRIINDETEITKILEGDEEKTNVRLIDFEKNELLSRMENRWILENLAESGTAQGTAALIQKSTLLGKPNLYLEQYATIDNATAADYYMILIKYMNELPPIRIYSADSKK